MLVLSRKEGERIRIGHDIELVVLKSKGNRVALGISAPKDLPIKRTELLFEDEPVDQLSTIDFQPRSGIFISF